MRSPRTLPAPDRFPKNGSSWCKGGGGLEAHHGRELETWPQGELGTQITPPSHPTISGQVPATGRRVTWAVSLCFEDKDLLPLGYLAQGWGGIKPQDNAGTSSNLKL